MAELSAETQAIVDRLKAEGDLVRNSGTNSLRAMNIKLDKFEGLFESINANLIEQTSFMSRQLGIASDAAERARTNEQYEEVQAPLADQTTPTDNNDGARRTDEAIDKMSKNIENALSFKSVLGGLKNLAIAGAGMFVGYNLLKGFVNERYDGAWTDMEEGIVAAGPALKAFGETGFADLKTTMADIKTQMQALTGPEGTITRLNTSLENIIDKMDYIANLGLGDAFGLLLGSISAITVGAAALRLKLTSMRLELEEGTRTRNGKTWWQRMLGVGEKVDPNAPKVSATPLRTPMGQVSPNFQPESQAKPNVKPAAAPPRTSPGSMPLSADQKLQIRQDAAKLRSNQFRMTSNGRLQNVNGNTFASDQAALDALEKTLDPRYSKIFKNLIKILKVAGVAALLYTAYQIYVVLSDDETYPTDNDKIMALSPIIGSAVGGLGGAALGAMAGTMGGPWGALIGGIAGGVAGAFLGSKLGGWIAKWAFDQDPSESDNQAVSLIQVKPRPNGGHDKRNWERAFGDTHLPDGTPRAMLPPPETVPSSVAGQSAPAGSAGSTTSTATPDTTPAYYQQTKNGRRYNTFNAAGQILGGSRSRPSDLPSKEEYMLMQQQSSATTNAALQNQVAQIEAAGTGGTVVIHAPTDARQNVTVTDGGNQVTLANISGGGGNGFGGGSNPYGLNLAIA